MLKPKNTKFNRSGFTIVEVILVLAIASLILLVVFMAVPQLQRNRRNTQRNRDATSLGAAIIQCINENTGRPNLQEFCSHPYNISFDPSRDFGIYTGFHYGRSTFVDGHAVAPTVDEPNYLFSLKCTTDGTYFVTAPIYQAVITFLIESPGTPGNPDFGVPDGYKSRCLDA